MLAAVVNAVGWSHGICTGDGMMEDCRDRCSLAGSPYCPGVRCPGGTPIGASTSGNVVWLVVIVVAAAVVVVVAVNDGGGGESSLFLLLPAYCGTFTEGPIGGVPDIGGVGRDAQAGMGVSADRLSLSEDETVSSWFLRRTNEGWVAELLVIVCKDGIRVATTARLGHPVYANVPSRCVLISFNDVSRQEGSDMYRCRSSRGLLQTQQDAPRDVIEVARLVCCSASGEGVVGMALRTAVSFHWVTGGQGG